MYEITFTKTSLRQLKKLEKAIQKRVIATLERIRLFPYKYASRLREFDYYRLRIGKHRAILDIKENPPRIIVLEVGHRKNIYESL